MRGSKSTESVRAGREPARSVLLVALILVAFSLSASADEAEVLFRFPAGGIVTTGPVIADGRLWFISDSKTLYVVTVDGEAVGKRTISSKRVPYIACDPFGRAAIPEGASSIVLVNKAGQAVWTVDPGSTAIGAPVFSPDGRMYVG
ncbi:MAG: hypothetical protein E4H20_05050, partial [Spirochaetales bacterium]